jgi:uncharacterized protein (DUF302 family)
MVYGFSKIVPFDYDRAVERVTEELKKEGFGVLTTIDVRDTMKKKLDVDFRRYVILGACNPPFAHRALTAEIDVGLLMPCNVIVYENDRKETVVGFFDPVVMARVIEKPGMDELARELKARLERVRDAL